MDLSYSPGTYTAKDSPQIPGGYRVRVVPDLYAESPMTWGRDDITADSDIYQQWARGKVYGVIVERSVTVVLVNLKTQERSEQTTWDEVESRWSCYLGPEYTGLMVAHELVPILIGTSER